MLNAELNSHFSPNEQPTGTNSPTAGLLARLGLFAGDIKIAHTVFALPFALLSTFLAAYDPPRRWPRPGEVLLILVCMFTARTIAMAANRLMDARLDALNPRTARRAIPSGALSRSFYGVVVVLCVVGFLAASCGFYVLYRNPWPLLLSVPVFAFLSAYPLLKRFTRLCHYYLGAALALAPICAWVSIRSYLAAPPLLMAGAVVCWTAGFDIIYACQDYACDVATGVFSVPARVGIGPALWISRLTHVMAAIFLVLLARSASPPLGTFYLLGVALAIGLLVVEHSIVRPNDLSKVGLAFFTVNGIISVLLGTLGIMDVLTR